MDKSTPDTAPEIAIESDETSSELNEHQVDTPLQPADVSQNEGGGDAELSVLVDGLQAEIKDLQDQLLRRAAEFQNYRRRAGNDIAFAADRGRGEVVLALIDVYDDLKRSLDAAEKAAEDETPGPAYTALHDGVGLVYSKFSSALEQIGVEHISSVGQPFDENVHDAMMRQPADDKETPPGTVIAEIQPGYKLKDRVLRHAQVVVAE